jgi:hypothetical protein
MQHSYIDSSNGEFKHPIFGKCGAPMWLARIEPDTPDHDKRTFDCHACGNTIIEIAKYR